MPTITVNCPNCNEVVTVKNPENSKLCTCDGCQCAFFINKEVSVNGNAITFTFNPDTKQFQLRLL